MNCGGCYALLSAHSYFACVCSQIATTSSFKLLNIGTEADLSGMFALLIAISKRKPTAT